MGDLDHSQPSLPQEVATPTASDSLTSGITPTAVAKPVTSADVRQAVVGAAPNPETGGAVGKPRVPYQVEKSQGSFAALNKLLHSLTAGSPKSLKKDIEKGSTLSDAQVQQCIACFRLCHLRCRVWQVGTDLTLAEIVVAMLKQTHLHCTRGVLHVLCTPARAVCRAVRYPQHLM